MTTHMSPALEDYLESVFIIQKKEKVVRVKDIASLMNVKAPSAIEALTSLKKKELVIHERYGHIELTPKGEEKARVLYAKHMMLQDFFHKILGMEKQAAEEDACRIEHYLSPSAIRRMLAFIEFVENPKKSGPDWIENFKSYLEKKKISSSLKKNKRKKMKVAVS